MTQKQVRVRAKHTVLLAAGVMNSAAQIRNSVDFDPKKWTAQYCDGIKRSARVQKYHVPVSGTK